MKTLEYIVFEVGGEAYGLEAPEIKEIIRVRDIRLNKVPKTPPFIKGLMNLRGEILPVIHLQERFDFAKVMKSTEVNNQQLVSHTSPSEAKRLIVAKVRHYHIGLLVDRVLGHYQTEDAEFLLPTAPMSEETPYLKGLVVMGSKSFFVLNTEILESREWENA